METADVQEECRQRWKDIDEPPDFFFMCNDPLGTEEAQITNYLDPSQFEANIESFREAVATSLNNLKGGDAQWEVQTADVFVLGVEAGYFCDANLTASGLCKNLLAQQEQGIRVQFRVANQGDSNSEKVGDIDALLFNTDVFAQELGNVMAILLGVFSQVALTAGRDSTICDGASDQHTCLAGDVCRPITERVDYTTFTPDDWWLRADRKWFGGDVPSQADMREWYCDYDPRLFLGKVKVGQLGTADFYLRNANLNVKSECDRNHGGLGGPDIQCETVNATHPVPSDCCGYCFLSNLHIMKVFNCKGMQDPLTNRLLVNTIRDYCIRTQICSEERPCKGDPVEMGDPFQLLATGSYDIYCDPLDRGCEAKYVDGRPVQPGERVCGYKFACDFRIESIRRRIGWYNTELFLDTPTEEPGAKANVGAIVGGLLGGLTLLGLVGFGIWRYLRREEEKKRKKQEKEWKKYQKRRATITGK
mmetsp:Transcript_21632/g.33850  ORF Transcript_21632/g.33850 Transcript_21632/m.33850 type:complete len:476 (-) Transcript_21632:106-1533(-)